MISLHAMASMQLPVVVLMHSDSQEVLPVLLEGSNRLKHGLDFTAQQVNTTLSQTDVSIITYVLETRITFHNKYICITNIYFRS